MTGEKKEDNRICKYVSEYVDYKCSRQALPGDEHCIFHSENIEGKKEKFNDSFWKELERQKEHEENYDFTGFIFPGDISFERKIFERNVYFLKAQFSGEADFRGAQFYGKAVFKYAQFSGGAYFNKVKFKEEANFENITLEKYKSFIMIDTYFYDVSGLFEFIEANKKKFKYSNKTKFLPDNFYLILGEETEARYPIISRNIRDDMYLLSFKKKHPKMHFIWWLFADCGRSFLRWAAWCIFFACLFGFVFWGMGTNNFDIPEGHTPFAYFYYSIVTFTTLGFGDIVPTTLFGRILVTIEVILGYIGLGGLISILANKLARRS